MIEKKQVQRKWSPHVFIILIFLIFLSALLTYVIPAGEFERMKDAGTGQSIVVAESFRTVQGNPTVLWMLPMKFVEALVSESTVKLIFFIFFIGGSFEIITQTGSITAFFGNILKLFKNNKIWIIPVFVSLFSILGFTMGLTTASIIFVPIGILAARKLGFGVITGTAMVALGVNAGFAAGVFNPFSVGIAQTIAEVPLYSGAWIRWLLLIFLLFATSIYIMIYGKKYDILEVEETIPVESEIEILSFRQKLVLGLFVLTFGIVTYGIAAWKWDTKSISVLFLVSGVLSGLVYGFDMNTICETFVVGCKKMVKGALVIGLASTMRLVLSEGGIMDSIAYYLTGIAYGFPKWAKLMGLFYGNAALDLIITSGSAHAAVAMPIMIPMTDFMGISRQSAVFTFQLGDGLVNLCSPISTTLTGILAVSEIAYGKWVKFFFPLVGIYMIIGTAFVILANLVGY